MSESSSQPTTPEDKPRPLANAGQTESVTHQPVTPGEAATLPPDESAPESAHRPWPTIPGYEVLSELGRGGMGVVYKAKQLGLNRIVALKMILSAEHASPEQLARFRAEAEAVARLQHPNIVQIHEIGESKGCPYFSLEYVDGGSLRDMKGKLWKAESAARMVATLAEAMHYAHERGIIHRDLKPANVLLTADGTPKITDFGLAKRLEGDSGQTRTGQILGTPSYMAPEQADGKKREIGPATDVYALGAILYELLTGRAPFQAETPLDTILKVVSGEIRPLSEVRPGVPRDLQTIALKCLHKDPRNRYASAAELALDLKRFLGDEVIAARPPGWIARSWGSLRRKPKRAALFFIIMLIALSGVAYTIRSLCFWTQSPITIRVENRGPGEIENVMLRIGDKRLDFGQIPEGVTAVRTVTASLPPLFGPPTELEFQFKGARGEWRRAWAEHKPRSRLEAGFVIQDGWILDPQPAQDTGRPLPQVLSSSDLQSEKEVYFQFLRWKEGLSVLLVDDNPGGARSGLNFRAGGPAEGGDNYWGMVPAERPGIRSGVEWHLTAADGKKAFNLTIDAREYDFSKGTLFVIKTKGVRFIEILQLKRDLSVVPPGATQCRDYIKNDAEVMKFLRTGAVSR